MNPEVQALIGYLVARGIFEHDGSLFAATKLGTVRMKLALGRKFDWRGASEAAMRSGYVEARGGNRFALTAAGLEAASR